MTPWLFLALAIALEVSGTLLLKLSNGFEKPLLGVASLVLYSLCFVAFAPAVKDIPVGVAYAVWAGVGIAAAAVLGFFVFSEKLSWLQMVCLTMVLVGALGLRLTTSET